jgi:cellulose synthase (UDP-forming)
MSLARIDPDERLPSAPDTDERESDDRRRGARDSPSLMMLVLIATIGVLLYTTFLFDFSNRGNWIPYLIVLVAETVIIFQALLSLWTILSSGHNPRGYRFHNAQTRLYGPQHKNVDPTADLTALPMHLHETQVDIDVYITTYGEDLQTIRRTAEAAVAMHGRHTTYILDDGKSEDVRALAAEIGAEYIVREGNAGAKAGNINHALGVTKGEFFVILDADFVPAPDFLYQTVPFFAEANVAFVQTPQAYGNLHNLISRGAGYMQSVFYRFIQPGKNRFNAAFCVGTNVIFRRTAIEQIGGMYTDSKSEDVWTSLRLHEFGWKSVYISTVLAIGDTPETIEAYTKQQLRWATGGFEILLKRNPFSRKLKLTLDQRMQYFGTATFYMVGIAPGLLLLVPPLQIYFGLAPINSGVSFGTWLLYYLGFYFMQVVVALYTIGSFRWETLMLATASFPIYGRALVNAVFKRDQKWHVTGAVGRKASPFNFITHQLMAFVFLAITSVVGIWQALTVSSFTLALLWNLLNTFILGLFVVTALRESRGNRREAKGLPRESAKRAARRAAKAQRALGSDRNAASQRLVAGTDVQHENDKNLTNVPRAAVATQTSSDAAVAPAFEQRSAADRTLASVESAQ